MREKQSLTACFPPRNSLPQTQTSAVFIPGTAFPPAISVPLYFTACYAGELDLLTCSDSTVTYLTLRCACGIAPRSPLSRLLRALALAPLHCKTCLGLERSALCSARTCRGTS